MYPKDTLDEEGYEQGHTHGRKDSVLEHPCLALRKLLSGGSFYYSADFDLTSRLQDRERYVYRWIEVSRILLHQLRLQQTACVLTHTMPVRPISLSTLTRSTKATCGTHT